MIYSHQHIAHSQDKKLHFGKQIQQIAENNPLVVITQEDQFLTFTIQQLLWTNSIPSKHTKVKKCQLQDGAKVIDHEVPLFIFSNQILQKYQILEFICDIAYGDRELRIREDNQFQYFEYVNRKSTTIEIAKEWGKILEFEKYNKRKGFNMLEDIGVSSQQQYRNHVFQSLQFLSMKFKGKILSQSFSEYSEEKPTLQNILLVDIIESLLRDSPDGIPLFYIKMYFRELLDLKDKFKKIINQAQPIARNSHSEIILDEHIAPNQIQWPTQNTNWSKFMTVFGLTSLIYAIWVKRE